MNFVEYIKEDDYILYITEWSVQKQFGYDIYEIYDTNIIPQKRKSYSDFSTKFGVKGNKWYIFDAVEDVKNPTVYVVGFYGVNDIGFDMFKPKKDVRFIGDIIAGVFRSIERLIKEKEVSEIKFNSDDKDLIQFYDKLSKYVEKRFNFCLINREKYGNLIQWTYRKNED